MNTGNAAAFSQPEFNNLQEALATGCYIEELLDAEHQWITNRLSWLFVSQSFLLVGFVMVITSPPQSVRSAIRFTLTWGLPVVGFVTCLAVSLGLIAAQHEAKKLADARAKVTEKINTFSPVRIPLIGSTNGYRDAPWTLPLGALPHRLIPWVLTLLWAILLLAFYLDLPRH